MPHPSAPSQASPHSRRSGPWGQERRLEFIDFRLRWDGRLNRGDLVNFFGISIPQASADIARYSDLAPDNLKYDRSERVYMASTEFRPLFPATSTEHYLSDLLALSTGVLSPEASYLGWRPPVAIAAAPTRAIASEVLTPILRAIREKLTVHVRYQSMSRVEPAWRALSPHAICHDSFRWHARAYCHERGEFRDFVLARMLEIQLGETSSISAQDDNGWNTNVRLVLTPNPGLSPAKRKAIEIDYAMSEGSAVLVCRQSLLYYVLCRLGLHDTSSKSPETQQVVLRNAEEIASYLPSAAS